MDREWNVTPVTSRLKDRAWSQLGTSGSGNHFVEFGELTVLDLPVNALEEQTTRLTHALERETRFGMGATFRSRRQHDVMDREWNVTPVTSRLKDRAWSQLGTSGSGNHFVEFGELTVLDDMVGLERGTYLALLSHSGSRGTGAQVAQHYSRLARELHPELPRELAHLAWRAPERPVRPYAATQTFAVGDLMEHPKFGRGTVLSCMAQRIEVEFPDGKHTLVHTPARK